MKPMDLKKWRIKNDWSQAQLALALGVRVLAVSRWELGVRRIPSFLHLALELLEIKGDELKPETKRRRLRAISKRPRPRKAGNVQEKKGRA